MRLSAARIRDVRSVWGPPLDVPIGPRVTVLVGPNRAGSSNVAWAIVAALDATIRFRPARDLPRRDRRAVDAAPSVELTWDDHRHATVRWDRDRGVRSTEGWELPDGRVVHSHVHETPRDVLRRLGERVEDAHVREELAGAILAACQRVLPEVHEVVIGDDLAVEVTDDLATPLPVAEVRALAAVGIARYLAEAGDPPIAVLVEAPEAFLHPAAQEAMAGLLDELASEARSPVLVTTSSPFAIPRVAETTVVALARDTGGRTGLVGAARGDETQARLLGGLLRDDGLAAVLDRVGEVAPGTRGVLIVEGGTDEAYLRLAADRLGRSDALEGIVIRPAGGAMAAALAAAILRAETAVPLLVLLDHDDPGRRARDTLVSRFRFDRSREVLTYADVFDGGPVGIEAETLFDVQLLRRFVRERGPSALRTERQLGAVEHVDLTPSGKSAFVGWLERHAAPEHLERWGDLLDLLDTRFAAGA